MVQIICADSLSWLSKKEMSGSIITSLPDKEEIGLDIKAWEAWFIQAATRCFEFVEGTNNPVIFYQTDRKHGGEWHSKAGLLIGLAKDIGIPLIWHKICLVNKPGGINLFRPSYSHLLCFSHSNPLRSRCENRSVGKATPDVLETGHKLYKNGMGIQAAKVALDYLSTHSETLIDPFCGVGTLLSLAQFEYSDTIKNIIGIDIDPEQVKRCEDTLHNPFEDWLNPGVIEV